MLNQPNLQYRSPALKIFSALSVSLYLIVVLAYLLAKGRLKSPFPLHRIFLSRLRPAYRGALDQVRPEIGHCFVGQIPDNLISDREGYSHLIVLENGSPLPSAHAAHDTIRTKGKGNYSHWGKEVYFSTSDNSSPLVNGREYSVQEVRA